MDRDAALEKIRKCLALSSSPNENEARTALLMARRLMAEYKIGSGEEIAEGQMPEQRMSSITYTTIRDNWVIDLLNLVDPDTAAAPSPPGSTGRRPAPHRSRDSPRIWTCAYPPSNLRSQR